MPDDDHAGPPLRASDADRDRVAGLLGEALADGRLTAEEHRERIDALYATRTQAELAPLTADLGTAKRDVQRPASVAPARRIGPQVAVLSSTMARPAGHVGGRIVCVAFVGSARIDLSHASLDEDGVEIVAQAIVGTVDVVVPPDALVTMTGLPLLGDLSPTTEPGPAGGPHVKVSAFALLGSVTIHRAKASAGGG